MAYNAIADNHTYLKEALLHPTNGVKKTNAIKCMLTRLRGGVIEGDDVNDPVALSIKSAKRHGIQIIHGKENDAAGNCAIESVIYNIQERSEFSGSQKVAISIQEARELWVTLLETTMERDYPELIPHNIPRGGINSNKIVHMK